MTPTAGHAEVNGLRMYHEVHGGGTPAPPLVLLHGGGSTIGTNFARILPALAATRQVIAVEFQAIVLDYVKSHYAPGVAVA